MADYNFSNGVEPERPRGVGGFVRGVANAYQRAGQISQERRVPNNDLERETMTQRLEFTRWAMHEKAYNMQMQIKAKEGMAKIGEVLASGSFDDPLTLRKALGIASQYGIDSEVLQPLMKRFNDAQEYQQRSSLLEREYGLRMDLARQESQSRIEKDAAYQGAIMDRERFKQAEISRRQDEKLKAAQSAYQARLDYLRETGKNDPMLDSKERLFSAKAQAITRDEWAYETPQQVQDAIDKAYQDVFGNQASPPPAQSGGTNAPAASRKKYNPETGLLE